MKHALIAASLVLVAGSAAGCGGGAPQDASVKEFCGNFTAIGQDVAKLGEDAKDTEIVTALKKAGTTIEETGTPKGISEDARAGFEVTVHLIEDLDAEASKDDISKIDNDLDKTEKKQEDAFNAFVAKTCQN